MNGQNLVDRAEARFGDSDNAVFTAAEWLTFVNEAYMDVVIDDPLAPYLESRDTSITLSAGDGEATLPTDVWHVTAVFNSTDNIPLAPIPGRSEFRRYFPEPASGQGMPLYYRLRGNTLEVYPTPSSSTALTLDVLVPPAVLTVETEPVFPEQFHRILVDGALAKAHADDENLNQSAYYQGRFDRGMQKLRVFLQQPRTESYPEVLDTF